jgi:hypothetical protein
MLLAHTQVAQLLERGADIEAMDRSGWSDGGEHELWA